MKFIIKESRLNELIYQYIDDMFSNLEIHWTHPEEYDEDSGELYEDPNRILFYVGDFMDDDDVFRWYDKEYFDIDSSYAPLVVVGPRFAEELHKLFDDYWKEPLKEWFRKKFDLPVKTIE